MLRFEQVSVRYGDRTALDSVTFHARQGMLYGLIGPNGSGKTTWLKTSAGLLAPAQGTITIGGKNLSALTHRQRARQIAYMPQVRETPDMTALQLVRCGRHPHIAFGGRLAQADHEQVQHAMEQVGVTPFADRHMRELSGGEQQRAFLAMMLAQQTDVLLLDEPANHLDPARQMETAAMLSRIAHAGKTVLMTVHNLPLALQTCDVLILLDAGRLAAAGTVSDEHLLAQIQRVFDVALHRSLHGWVVAQSPTADGSSTADPVSR